MFSVTTNAETILTLHTVQKQDEPDLAHEP